MSLQNVNSQHKIPTLTPSGGATTFFDRFNVAKDSGAYNFLTAIFAAIGSFTLETKGKIMDAFTARFTANHIQQIEMTLKKIAAANTSPETGQDITSAETSLEGWATNFVQDMSSYKLLLSESSIIGDMLRNHEVLEKYLEELKVKAEREELTPTV
jgi:hypothetical protein